MKRLLVWMLSVTLLLGLLTGCSFQKEEPTEVTYTPEQIEALESLGLMYDKARPSHKIGTSYTLRKDAAVVVFLADDNESQWDDASAEAFIQMVDEAMDFICHNAKEYGVELTLPRYIYRTTQERQIRYDGTVTTGGDQLDALIHMAKCLGHGEGISMHEAFQQELGMEQVAYIVATNKSSHSFAQALDHRLPEYIWCVPEYCVIDFPGDVDRTGIVAHEFLHMFGAQDFYRKEFDGASGLTVYNEGRVELAKSLCPDEIMLGGRNPTADSTISSFTAYTVGWLDELPEEYNCDQWWVGSQWEESYIPE